MQQVQVQGAHRGSDADLADDHTIDGNDTGVAQGRECARFSQHLLPRARAVRTMQLLESHLHSMPVRQPHAPKLAPPQLRYLTRCRALIHPLPVIQIRMYGNICMSSSVRAASCQRYSHTTLIVSTWQPATHRGICVPSFCSRGLKYTVIAIEHFGPIHSLFARLLVQSPSRRPSTYINPVRCVEIVC